MGVVPKPLQLIEIPFPLEHHVHHQPAVIQEDPAAILQALRESGGSRMQAAAKLGISVSTLWRKMREMGLTSRSAQ